MTQGDPQIPQNNETFTFTIKKTTLYIALATAIGFSAGIGAARLFMTSALAEPEVSGRNDPQAGQFLATASSPSSQPAAPVEIAIDGRPYVGPDHAEVTIVEFTDYQCPFCGRHFRETLPQLLSEYEDSVKFVIRNFPRSSIHPFAQKASEAAECAFDQGKFWEYHDNLFENQAALDSASLKTYAEEIGLDSDAFNACLDSGANAERVLRDFRDGQSYGVTGTPTFFINGQRVVGALPFRTFQSLIDAALSN